MEGYLRMKQLGTGIVILFVLLSLGIVGLGYLQRNAPEPQKTPLELKLTVNPMAQTWMRQVVRSFNDSDTRIIGDYIVTITLNNATIDDMTVWLNDTWTDQNHPDLWLPSTSLAVNYAGYPIRSVIPSVAQSPLVWVASDDVAQAITQDGNQTFGWDTVQAAAQAETWANFGASAINGNVNIAFSLPNGTMNGLMVLYSSLSHFNEATTIANNSMTPAYQSWFLPIRQSVPNFTSIGDNVATFMVTQQGISVNIGMLPEAQLLNQLEALINRRDIQVAYPEYAVVFDFPLAEWQVTNLSAENASIRQQAIQAFADWLLAPDQQAQLAQNGLRPIAGNLSEEHTLFRMGAEVGIEYAPSFENRLTEAPFAFAGILLSWFSR
jgi:hypothetical protein